MECITVSSKGQICIPKAVREKLELHKGSRLNLELEGGRLILSKAADWRSLRGLALPDLRLESLKHLGLHTAVETVQVEAGARAIGNSPVGLALRNTTGATVVAAIRNDRTYHAPDPGFRFEEGDIVVLTGSAEALAAASQVFRAPPASDTAT